METIENQLQTSPSRKVNWCFSFAKKEEEEEESYTLFSFEQIKIKTVCLAMVG